MTRVFRRLALLFVLVLLPAGGGSFAQERVLDPARAVGIDGVVTQCVSFVRIRFANAMCDELAGHVAAVAQKAGVRHLHLGRAEWGFGSDAYLPLPDDTGMASPARLTFYVRATDRPVSAFIWASLYVEAPTDAARPGRLVLWEDSGIGAGKAKSVSQGLAQGLARKLEPVFEVLAAANGG